MSFPVFVGLYMRVLTITSVMLVALLSTHSTYAIDAQWDLKKNKDGIKVYTGKVEQSPFKAVRSVTTMRAKMPQLVAIIRDTAACSELSSLCKSAYEHKVTSETELYVYNLNDLPWPVADRDALTHVRWSRDSTTGAVTMVATIVGDIVAPKKKIIRLTYGTTWWILTPLNENEIEVASESHIDPEGSVPAWITNKLLVDAPFDTLLNLRNIVASGRHADATYSFLSDPTTAERSTIN